jgi:cobalt-zinc-cadmium efflux system outer membrane protein
VDAPSALPAFPVVRALESEADAATHASSRAEREAWGTLDLGPRLTRGDFGELRTGLVFGGSLPLVRRNQGEVARLDAEAVRARKLATVATTTSSIRVHAAFERASLARATLAELDANAIPAAERTVTSAQEAFRAGKGDFYRILLARRDLVAARMRRLDVVELAWGAYAELLALGAIEP